MGIFIKPFLSSSGIRESKKNLKVKIYILYRNIITLIGQVCRVDKYYNQDSKHKQ